LRVGGLAQSVTVSGASPLVHAQNVARLTVISNALLDTVPTGKNLLSFYSLTPAAVTPTNAQDVGGSKGETTARVSIHGSKQGDTKMMIDALEKQAIEQAMRDAAGNKVRAARRLGISRMQLYGRLQKFGLENT
jgi:DNA-binding NtrC family response regulator